MCFNWKTVYLLWNASMHLVDYFAPVLNGGRWSHNGICNISFIRKDLMYWLLQSVRWWRHMSRQWCHVTFWWKSQSSNSEKNPISALCVLPRAYIDSLRAVGPDTACIGCWRRLTWDTLFSVVISERSVTIVTEDVANFDLKNEKRKVMKRRFTKKKLRTTWMENVLGKTAEIGSDVISVIMLFITRWIDNIKWIIAHCIVIEHVHE